MATILKRHLLYPAGATTFTVERNNVMQPSPTAKSAQSLVYVGELVDDTTVDKVTQAVNVVMADPSPFTGLILREAKFMRAVGKDRAMVLAKYGKNDFGTWVRPSHPPIVEMAATYTHREIFIDSSGFKISPTVAEFNAQDGVEVPRDGTYTKGSEIVPQWDIGIRQVFTEDPSNTFAPWARRLNDAEWHGKPKHSVLFVGPGDVTVYEDEGVFLFETVLMFRYRPDKWWRYAAVVNSLTGTPWITLRPMIVKGYPYEHVWRTAHFDDIVEF